MKKTIPLLLCFSFLVLSCTHDALEIEESIALTKEDVVGDWRSFNTIINGTSAEETFGAYFPPNLMGLKENNNYYFNYNSGTWKIEGNQIILENERDLTVLRIEKDTMTLEAEILASQTFFNIPGVEPDETIIIREDFFRN